MPTNTNASRTAFGWLFQTNAALVLMLRNIDEAESVRVEGKFEDIEIRYADGSVDYAQAKARTTNTPGDNSTIRFSDAIHTLAEDAQKADCRRAMFVTNDFYPLGKSHSDIQFESDTMLSFSELSPKQQDYVLAQFLQFADDNPDVAVDIDAIKNHFSVYVMWFYGEDERTRTRQVKQAIQEFFGRIDSRLDSRFIQRLYNSWSTQLRMNEATVNTDLTIEKSRFIWPLIIVLIEAHEDDEFFEDIDDEMRQDILECYGQVIDEATDRFDLITKIQTDYEAYRRTHRGTPKDMRKTFTHDHVAIYRDLVGADAISDEEACYVTALIIKKVITKKDMISKVREEVNLAD